MKSSFFTRIQALRYSGLLLSAALLWAAGCHCRKPADNTGQQPRIVSLAPNLTEIICAMGGSNMLVGRTSACDYPPEVTENIPVVGGFGAPSLELLVSLSPSLVLDVDLADDTAGHRMADLGINRKRIHCRNLADIPVAIREIGAVCGREATAGRLANHIEASLSMIRARAKEGQYRPAVYAEIWHDPMMTAGRRSFLSQLISLAGGRNIGDEVDSDYFHISSEQVLAMDPDIILCLYESNDNDAARAIRSRPGWKQLKAVRSGAIFDEFDLSIVLRPGPRVLDGIEALRRCIAPHLQETGIDDS